MAEWILTAIIFMPIIGAIVVALQPDDPRKAMRAALASSCVTLVLTVVAGWMVLGNGASDPGFTLNQRVAWMGLGGDTRSITIHPSKKRSHGGRGPTVA